MLVAGASGAGKSTLLRALAGLLLTASHGDLSGRVRIGGRDAQDVPGLVGLLQQDPSMSVVAETVGRDVAFGLENRRVPRQEIWPRVRAALAASAFPYDVDRLTSALSGGEIQRLALAGSLVLEGEVLLLDEPTSMLDPASAAAVQTAVRRATQARHVTTVIVEHHLEPWLDFADRLIVLGGGGEIIADGDPVSVLADERDRLTSAGVWVPGAGVPPVEMVDPALVEPWSPPPDRIVAAEQVRVELRNSLLERDAARTVALDGVDATLRSGRALAITGASGAGKSTLVSVLAGLIRPTAGAVRAAPQLRTRKGDEPWRWSSRDLTERLSWTPQLPEHAVVTRTVREEVLASGRACRRDQERAERRCAGLLETFRLAQLADASPYHLSGGEQRRLMVAAALAHGPAAALLDEPTVGQDRHTWSSVLGALAAARDAGTGVGIATHDRAAVSSLADDELALTRGAP